LHKNGYNFMLLLFLDPKFLLPLSTIQHPLIGFALILTTNTITQLLVQIRTIFGEKQ
jgi:hypothetical protein